MMLSQQWDGLWYQGGMLYRYQQPLHAVKSAPGSQPPIIPLSFSSHRGKGIEVKKANKKIIVQLSLQL